MRASTKRVRFSRIPIAPCAGAFFYLLLIFACVIFTQALRSSLSAMVLIFVLLLPFADLCCLGISWFFVSVTVEGDSRVVVRGDRLSIPIRIANHGLISVSCAEAALSIPLPRSLHSRRVAKRVSLPPFSATTVGISVGFDCRGFFVIGVEEIFLFDFLRLVRLRKRISQQIEIRVLPKLLPPQGDLPPFQNCNASLRHRAERSATNEYDDIREYRPGDAMKNIHWKLSTKLDELQVRNATAESEKDLFLFADYGSESDTFRFDPSCASVLGDRVAEECLSTAVEAARQGAAGELMWFRSDGTPAVFPFFDVASAEKLAFPLSDTEGGEGMIPQDAAGIGSASTLFLLPFLSPAQEDKIRRTAAERIDAPFTVRLLSLEDLVLPEEREHYRQELENLKRRLSERGIAVSVSFREEVSS